MYSMTARNFFVNNVSNNARSDITNVVSVLSQFVQEPCVVHWEGALWGLAYIKHAPRKGFYIDSLIIFILRPILMLDMLRTKDNRNLLRVIAHMFEAILSLGLLENKRLSLV